MQGRRLDITHAPALTPDAIRLAPNSSEYKVYLNLKSRMTQNMQLDGLVYWKRFSMLSSNNVELGGLNAHAFPFLDEKGRDAAAVLHYIFHEGVGNGTADEDALWKRGAMRC